MISKYITLSEATKSPTAKRLGIENLPTDEHLENMKYVGMNLFDKVRDHFGVPIGVSSFYRSHELNEAVPGSSKTSQHMKGEAINADADMYGKLTNFEIFNFVKDNLEFDQLINEYPDKEGEPSWVHFSLVRHPKKNRGQVLVKLKSKYIPFGEYEIGMV